MPDPIMPHVCLLLDFENLVLGLQKMAQPDAEEELDVSLLFRLAEEHGQVVLANAYADWRNSNFNQYQIDLDKQGIDLIHVLGRGYKNAVDVKLAVDAIETLWTLPHIQTFVIVSGDRDFIHILKTLRRHGKKIVGVAPDVSASEDFAGLCDSFVKYSALKRTYSEAGGTADTASQPDRTRLEQALAGILSKFHVQGIKGATLKLLLKRELGQTFDESEFGYSKFSELLRSLPNLVRLEAPPVGDVTAYPANGDAPSGENAWLPARRIAPQVDAVLRDYRYQPDAAKRRATLRRVYEAMMAVDSFSQDELASRLMEGEGDSALSVTAVAKVFAILYQSYAFFILPDQDNVPNRQRRLRLKERFTTAEDLIRAYEYSIALKVCTTNRNATAEELHEVLGLDADNAEDVAYSAELHRQAKVQLTRFPQA